MWDLPGPGIEPVSPALAGGFLTTVPPGKPVGSLLCLASFTYCPCRSLLSVVSSLCITDKCFLAWMYHSLFIRLSGYPQLCLKGWIDLDGGGGGRGQGNLEVKRHEIE